jgi:mRNA-degrading endonuclease YafQ of YafQ-DinJ toxin-antitoxin module
VIYTIQYTPQYDKRARRFLLQHPDVEKQYVKTLELLAINPHHPSLRLHALAGNMDGVHSVSINLSYRITLHLVIKDKTIIPINVGDHRTVYGK